MASQTLNAPSPHVTARAGNTMEAIGMLLIVLGIVIIFATYTESMGGLVGAIFGE